MIIPSINRATFAEARADIRKAEEFVPQGGWLHIDVSDGRFSPWRSWGSPEEFREIGTGLNAEVHLMVEDPESAASPWFEIGAKRLIVPVQQVKSWERLRALAQKYGAEVAPSFDVDTPIRNGGRYGWAKCVGVLAVHPGQSGQIPHEDSLDKVGFLRRALPGVKIEFDGGVDLEVGQRALDGGADFLASGDYIFKSADPGEAFRKLSNLKPNVS